jgi:perosamine synthetase
VTDRKIPWWVPPVAGTELQHIERVLAANFLNDGPTTRDFEREFASMLGVPYAVAVTSGTAAIFLGLAACDVGPGDEVLVPDLTFIATANAVRLTGATPVLVDIDRATLTMDPDSAERAITKKTKAVVPVHVSGRAGTFSKIRKLADAHRLAVVEDAAEAFMSGYKGGYLGTFGRAGCFSFSPAKTFTTGQGGMVVTSDAALHTRLRQLKDQGRAQTGTGGDDVHPVLGYNFKFTSLQAAVGLAHLPQVPQRTERMRAMHRMYASALAGVPGITVVPFRDDEVPQWTDVLIENRDSVAGKLRARGMDTRNLWFPIHTQAPYKRPDEDFPNATWASPRALWLPSALTLTDDDIQKVCDAIQNAVRHPERSEGSAVR